MFAVAAILCAPIASAAELLMFERRGCVYCERFDQEIAPSYGTTRPGRIAPLRRFSVENVKPSQFQFLEPVVFTPTFVLIQNGREVGRLVGYPGKAWFYPEIETLFDKLESAE